MYPDIGTGVCGVTRLIRRVCVAIHSQIGVPTSQVYIGVWICAFVESDISCNQYQRNASIVNEGILEKKCFIDFKKENLSAKNASNLYT